MAQSQFSWDRGDAEGEVTVAADSATAPGGDIRVSWDDALTCDEIIVGVTVIERVLIQSDWPL